MQHKNPTSQLLIGSLLAAALLAGTAHLSAAPIEQLTNPGFEDPVTAGWGPAPTNWSIGAPEPSVVNYPWVKPLWSLVGDNPEGTQIAALNGNGRQTVGTVLADKVYTFSFSVYFKSNQQFYGDLTTTPWSGGLVRFINDGVTIQNMPDPVPINQWIDLTATINTSLPVFAGAIGQPLYVHFWSTGTPNEILLDDVSLLMDDAPPYVPPDYYVSFSEGNDSNDGLSPATPWKTFTNLSSLSLGPGTTVNLKRGDTWAASKLVLAGKGTLADPIRLTAYGDGRHPIITGINMTTEPAVVVNNPSHWEIDSLELRDAKVGLYLRYTGGNTDGTGAMFNNENITISNCHFMGMDLEWSDGSGAITVLPPYELSWGAGVWVGGSVPAPPGGPWASQTTTVLDGLTVRHCSFQNVSTGVGTGWYFPGAYMQRLRNILLEDSWVTGCENGSFAFFDTTTATVRRWDTWLGGEGFYASGTTGGFLQGCTSFTIDNSEFAGNLRNVTGNDGTGFDFEGNTEAMTFTNNVVHDNDGAGLLILETDGDNNNLVMQHNTFWNDCRDPKDSGQNKALTASGSSATAGSGLFGNNGVYLGTDVSSGLAVYNNTTRWNSFFLASTSGNRTTTAWSAVSGRPTAWTFAGSVEGWGGQNQWTGFAASGGALTGTSSGADPYVESADTWVNTRERRWVLVTMSQTAGANAQVFFQTEADATWTPGKSVAFPIIADGTMRTYIVDMGQSSEYRGVVTRWRLDPTDASGSTMAIDAFGSRIDPYIASATAVSHNEVDVVFNMPMQPGLPALPGEGVFAPANYAISGTGQGTLAANPTTVSQIATPQGPVYRLKWSSGASTGDPATITVSNAKNARGHAIGLVSPSNAASFTTIAGPSGVSDWMLLDN